MGASASMAWMSVLQSAKANGLNEFEYTKFILKRLPYAKTKEDYLALLPHRVDPEKFKNLYSKKMKAVAPIPRFAEGGKN